MPDKDNFKKKSDWLRHHPKLLKVGDVAEMLHIHSQTAYRWAANGIIPSIKIGQARRFRRAAILDYIERVCTGDKGGTDAD